MRIILKIQYDGTEYCGWQVQPNGVTVQEVIETAIEKLTGKTVRLVGSGRTDAGVHAEGQVAHFDIDGATVPPEKFPQALNGLLPSDIKILSGKVTDENFHARFSAKKKTYEYKAYYSEYPLPLKSRYAVNIPFKVDIEIMKKFAGLLVGKKDFKCFLASNSDVKDTVREIYASEIYEKDGYIVYSVTGNGFLYNMVRIIVGTLLKAGAGKMTEEEFLKMLSVGDRSLAGATMPPNGLTLKSVDYFGEDNA